MPAVLATRDRPFVVEQPDELRGWSSRALVCGRRLFDLTNGWDDNHPIGAPVVVVTHNAPRDTTKWPHTTFVNGVSEGIAGAREIAGDKDVAIASADIARQALDLGLVGERGLRRPGASCVLRVVSMPESDGLPPEDRDRVAVDLLEQVVDGR